MSNKFYVSRQSYWGCDEPLVVEIASGGMDYANADMLSDPDGRYRKLGCDQEYIDPVESLRVAFRVRKAWQKALRDEGSDETVRIEVGYTGGNTIPFEEYPTNVDLYQWAKEKREKMPKCDQCGNLLEYCLYGDPDIGRFCSEFCAEEYERENFCDEDVGTVYCAVDGCETEATYYAVHYNEDGGVDFKTPLCETCKDAYEMGQASPKAILEEI